MIPDRQYCCLQDKEDWINAVGRAIVRHSKRYGSLWKCCTRCIIQDGRWSASCSKNVLVFVNYVNLIVLGFPVVWAVCWIMTKAITQPTCSMLIHSSRFSNSNRGSWKKAPDLLLHVCEGFWWSKHIDHMLGFFSTSSFVYWKVQAFHDFKCWQYDLEHVKMDNRTADKRSGHLQFLTSENTAFWRFYFEDAGWKLQNPVP